VTATRRPHNSAFAGKCSSPAAALSTAEPDARLAAEEYVVKESDQVAKGPESYSRFHIVMFSRPHRVFYSRKLILDVVSCQLASSGSF
jgi:hypothetical protein